MLRRMVQLLCAAGVGLGALVVAWVAAHLDDPLCDACSCRASRPVVPDEQDGMQLLEAAGAELWWPTKLSPRLEALRKGEALDPELEREVLRRNAAVLAAVPAVLAAPSFVVPDIDPELEVVHFDRANAWVTVSRLLSLRALHRARQGEREQALSDALAAARLGARIESGHGASLLEASFATAMKSIGLGALGRVLAAFELDAARSRELAEEISELHVSSEAWRRVWEFEYETQLRVIRSIEETFVSTDALLGFEDELPFRAPELLLRLVPERYLFKPNATRALYAEAFELLGTRGDGLCSRVRWPDRPPEGARRAGPLLGPNSAGRIATWMTFPVFAELALRRCESESRVEAARAWVALRAHSSEHGRLPERLEELAPTYLARVPIDFYDGATLRYDPKRRLLWSIGIDFRDAGGVGERVEEPVFPIPF